MRSTGAKHQSEIALNEYSLDQKLDCSSQYQTDSSMRQKAASSSYYD